MEIANCNWSYPKANMRGCGRHVCLAHVIEQLRGEDELTPRCCTECHDRMIKALKKEQQPSCRLLRYAIVGAIVIAVNITVILLLVKHQH